MYCYSARRGGAGAGVVARRRSSPSSSRPSAWERERSFCWGRRAVPLPGRCGNHPHIDSARSLPGRLHERDAASTRQLCRLLFDHRVTVAVKHNSFRARRSGRSRRGARRPRMDPARAAPSDGVGIPRRRHSLCVQSVICRSQPGRDRRTVGLGPRARDHAVLRGADRTGAGETASGSDLSPEELQHGVPRRSRRSTASDSALVGPKAAHCRIHLPAPSV